MRSVLELLVSNLHIHSSLPADDKERICTTCSTWEELSWYQPTLNLKHHLVVWTGVSMGNFAINRTSSIVMFDYQRVTPTWIWGSFYAMLISNVQYHHCTFWHPHCQVIRWSPFQEEQRARHGGVPGFLSHGATSKSANVANLRPF